MARIIYTAELEQSTPLTVDETSWVYNGLDCCVTAEVYAALRAQHDDVAETTYTISRDLQGPILEMNMTGILVDGHSLTEEKNRLDSVISTVEDQLNYILKEGYGQELNWRSPKQLLFFLYDYLKLPIQRKRNVHGQYAPTSDRMALERLRHHFVAAPFVNHMLILRDLGK